MSLEVSDQHLKSKPSGLNPRVLGSPELSPDATKDFSVYILDPLEDLMSKNRHGQSGGVAVGMGLLSSILSPYSQDTTLVTGTLVDCGQNEDALEIVVSLRQVRRIRFNIRGNF